ncbi:hypothetical protein A3A84_00590 [Candidatus Collierbacteria bacterium RIFCSPLOWO2_01_FULL_50_23]|uniref:Uncharacterized protein n=1 Tax=Candidatus Collierbacteria bacterium RIFCSPHIGHO2_01_FULL_50_25 TaxID=1817722 RepID=A0A1F5EX95_9BACT|nr:MAG: hypothetical protein A2703_03725 [Candidatus Collierbacteria bacterium RIFCSPHIGHO2_01_FULL_50_25]OGD74838.1 MAG: hypothetical protein A3A84_00590 [Candidatus Collierbacteria bacterium RIFCSPLOWO2_01_FULL_50_23]
MISPERCSGEIWSCSFTWLFAVTGSIDPADDRGPGTADAAATHEFTIHGQGVNDVIHVAEEPRIVAPGHDDDIVRAGQNAELADGHPVGDPVVKRSLDRDGAVDQERPDDDHQGQHQSELDNILTLLVPGHIDLLGLKDLQEKNSRFVKISENSLKNLPLGGGEL